MKTTGLILISTMALYAEANELKCKVQNSNQQGSKIIELTINPKTPTLSVLNETDDRQQQLIDDTYLGLLTEPMAWALRSECEWTQNFRSTPDGVVSSIENHFYCLLEDEGSPIGKIDANLIYDFQKKEGRYYGVAATMIDEIPAKKFQINFNECH